jgi:hypothetical protein
MRHHGACNRSGDLTRMSEKEVRMQQCPLDALFAIIPCLTAAVVGVPVDRVFAWGDEDRQLVGTIVDRL